MRQNHTGSGSNVKIEKVKGGITFNQMIDDKSSSQEIVKIVFSEIIKYGEKYSKYFIYVGFWVGFIFFWVVCGFLIEFYEALYHKYFGMILLLSFILGYTSNLYIRILFKRRINKSYSLWEQSLNRNGFASLAIRIEEYEDKNNKIIKYIYKKIRNRVLS